MAFFTDRVAVVTGGASGIGSALARAFAAGGARVVLADIDTGGMDRLAAELTASGATVVTARTDVTRQDDVEALARNVDESMGGAGVVCNNAGVFLGGPILDAADSDWRFVMDVNFWGVVNGVRSFAPRLVERGGEATS